MIILFEIQDDVFEDTMSSLVDELLGMPEQHTRPSSKHTAMEDETSDQNNEDSTNEEDSHDEL